MEHDRRDCRKYSIRYTHVYAVFSGFGCKGLSVSVFLMFFGWFRVLGFRVLGFFRRVLAFR